MYSAYHHKVLVGLIDQWQKAPDQSVAQKKYFEQFRLRIAANYHSIHFLVEQLYGNTQDHSSIAKKIASMLFDKYRERGEELKKLDLKREADPDWILSEKWVGMMLYVDHFAGDLKGFIKKIPYLEELGINWIHLMPLLKSPDGENDGGYAVSDYRKVDPRFGSMNDIRKITAEFRKRNMLLALDYVMNHTADEHPWAQKAKSGDTRYQKYFFMYDDRVIPDQFEQTMPEVFPESAPGNFTFDQSSEKWVMTQFHDYQWDLNYNNPDVLIEMLDIAFFLANQGIDILRLDAVPFLWKKIGTMCRNEYEAHVILRIFKACFQVVAPGVVFIAEAIVRPHEIMSYFGGGSYHGRECDIAYNATFMALCWEALATGDTSLMRRVTSRTPQKPHGTTWINYLRSHDDIGLGFDDEDVHALGINAHEHRKFILDYYSGTFPGSLATGAPFAYNPRTGDARISGTLAALSGLEKAIELRDEELIHLSINRILMLQSLVLSLGGLPMLYSGGEIGLTNDYGYKALDEKSYDNRWMHRPPMDWEKAKNRHVEGTIEFRIFQGLSQLIETRKRIQEFADKNTTSIEFPENKHVFAFLRWNNEGKRTLVMANFFNGNQFVKQEILWRIGLDPAHLIDAISGERPKYYHDLIEFKPYQSCWLQPVLQ